MPHRQHLLALLQDYARSHRDEAGCVKRFQSFVRHSPDCFDRALSEGHITGSAFLLSRDRQRVLLTHHRKLDAWLQLGGHADGNPHVLEVALREACEESGILSIEPISKQIFDLDIHRIPERRMRPDGGRPVLVEAEHLHYDVRFLLHAYDNETFIVGEESHDLAWVPLTSLTDYRCDGSILRMAHKWLSLTDQPEAKLRR